MIFFSPYSFNNMSTSEKTEPKTTCEIIKNWFENSPASGIRRIGQAKALFERLFWGYSFWVFTVFMTCFICISIVYHISHPTKIHLALRHFRDPRHFPAITFCNINPLKDDSHIDLTDSKFHTPPPSNLTQAEYEKIIHNYIERIVRDNDDQENPFVKWGYKLNDLLITCRFNQHQCNQNFKQIFHPNYGSCFTFDNDQDVQSEEINDIRYDWSINDNRDDKNYKLFLELWLNQRYYNPYLDRRAAFRIFIHQKQEIPIFSETSLFVRPNKYTKISFMPRVMSFYRQCRNNLTDDMKKILSADKVRYTQALCFQFCEYRRILNICKCIEPKFATFYQFLGNNQKQNETLCAVNDDCLSSPAYLNANGSCPDCLRECEVIQYSVQSSYAGYPNDPAKTEVDNRVRKNLRLEPRMSASEDYINSTGGPSRTRKGRLYNNIVAIEISSSQYPTEVLIESPMYTWVDLISSIGGQTSLWIGVSFISLVEIMELLYLLIERFCTYLFFCKNSNK